MTTIVSFVVVLGILILVHEFGHFVVARLAGVGVERFSIGFGPVLWRFRRKETEYCLSAVPLGGYVKMMGDDENPLEGGKTAVVDPAKAFNGKPLIARFLIVFAGPAMNCVLAVVIFALVFMILGRPVAPAVVGRLVEGGPVAQAGVRVGDQIVAVDGRRIEYWEDILRTVQDLRGETIQLTVRRDGSDRNVGVTPAKVKTRDLFGDEREIWDIGARPFVAPMIGEVLAGMPASQAGLRSGDTVVSFEGKPVLTWDDLAEGIHKRPGQVTRLEIKRGKETLSVAVTPTAVKERGPDGKDVEVGRIGIGPGAASSRCAAIFRPFSRTFRATMAVTGLLGFTQVDDAGSRVRLAVGPRATASTNPLLRAPRLFGRLAEVSVMVGVTLFAVGASLDPLTPSTSSLAPTQSVVREYFRAQPPLGDIDYMRWLRLVKADASSTVSDSTRLPMGGRFDYDPVEYARGPGAAPR